MSDGPAPRSERARLAHKSSIMEACGGTAKSMACCALGVLKGLADTKGDGEGLGRKRAGPVDGVGSAAPYTLGRSPSLNSDPGAKGVKGDTDSGLVHVACKVLARVLGPEGVVGFASWARSFPGTTIVSKLLVTRATLPPVVWTGCAAPWVHAACMSPSLPSSAGTLAI
eukprot:scaffold1093_cov359-Prasinococcus_capsulatus_cf.AAC.14